MTDEQRLEDTTEKLDDTDDVEAHKRRLIADEAKDTDKKDDDGDDVEAHRRR